MLLCAAALPILGALIVAPANADARSRTIHTSRGYVVKVGGLRTLGRSRDAGTLGATIRAFGRPSSIRGGRTVCRVRWRRLKVNAVFVNYGIGSACARSTGLLQLMTIKGSRFRTSRGIRVGSRSSLISRRHHSAVFERGAWTIASAFNPYGGAGGAYPTVRAIVRGGRVRALSLSIGAGGE